MGHTGGKCTRPRSFAASSFAHGSVLVAGGYDAGVAVAAAEIFDARTATFRATRSMVTPRGGDPMAVLLAEGRVVIFGGWADQKLTAAVELFE